jgi:hypothetical protein
MIIKQVTSYDEEDMTSSLEIYFDEDRKFEVYESEDTEDNTLGRNFMDCYEILNLLREVYELGKR